MATIKGIWVFNATLKYTEWSTQVSFTSNGITFSNIRSTDSATADSVFYYDDTLVYEDGWINEAYRIIDFGEEEQNDSNLLVYIPTLAVQTPTADLTNTTWNIPAGWTAEAGYGKFANPLKWNGGDYGGIGIGYAGEFDSGIFDLNSSANTVCVHCNYPPFSDLAPSDAFTLEILDGDSVTNPSLIWWLATNGEMEVEEAPTEYAAFTYNGKTYTLTVGQKVTFACEGKIMLDDITMVINGENEDVTLISFTIDGVSY